MANETIVDPQVLIDAYDPETPVVVGNDMQVTLGQALAAERAFCTADSIDRQDPSKRVMYLAGMLAAAGSLQPEHQHLVKKPEQDGA